MNAAFVGNDLRPWTVLAASAVRSWRPLLAGALAGALFAALVPPAIGAAREWLRAASHDEAAAGYAEQWPARELSREWRWSPPGVRVDRMFRTPR